MWNCNQSTFSLHEGGVLAQEYLNACQWVGVGKVMNLCIERAWKVVLPVTSVRGLLRKQEVKMQVHYNIQLTAPCLLMSFQSLLLTNKKLLCQRYYRPMSLLLRSSFGLFQRSRCLQMVQSYLMQEGCSFSGHVLVLPPYRHNVCKSLFSEPLPFPTVFAEFELPFFKDMSILRNTIYSVWRDLNLL